MLIETPPRREKQNRNGCAAVSATRSSFRVFALKIGEPNDLLLPLGQTWTSFPDDIDYGIEKAIVQSKAGDVAAASLTVAQIRRTPLAGTDPRVDLAEALAADTAGDSTQELQLGKRASVKGRQVGANQLLADAL